MAINITSAGKPEQKLEWAFTMYDINGDGTIDQKEMVEIISVSELIYFILFSLPPSTAVPVLLSPNPKVGGL